MHTLINPGELAPAVSYPYNAGLPKTLYAQSFERLQRSDLALIESR
jgi:hypothetical protein